MPATRQLREFKVRNTEGNIVTVQRRCAGSGKSVQKQLDSMVYDEAKKKFLLPKQTKEKKAAKEAEGKEHLLEDLNSK